MPLTVCTHTSVRRHPKYNKGLAFSDSERDRLYLRGLLPPVTLSQEVQLERTMLNLRTKASDLDKYTYMQSLQVRRAFKHAHLECAGAVRVSVLAHEQGLQWGPGSAAAGRVSGKRG